MKALKKMKPLLFIIVIMTFSFLGFGQSVPEPEEVLGFKVGADYHLATYTQAIEYFKKLEENSSRIKLFKEGKTSMGQTLTYAVIIMPDTYRSEAVINGYAKGTMPPKYVGGITPGGVRNLKLYVENGGTLIFMNSACNLAVEHFGLPVRNVLKKAKRGEFVCTGSILRMEFDTSHPLAYGMPKEAATIFDNSCAFDIMPSFGAKKEPKSISKYPEENPLMSGWIYGDRVIRQKAAILDIPYGKGKIILLGFPVQFRAQSYGTFRLLFNSIFYAGVE